MPRAPLKLLKTHAYGNDFLLVDRAGLPDATNLASLARAICHRHRGIGADGLVLADRRPTGARMQLLNADGSPAEVSGNGARCLAAWVAFETGASPGTTLTIDTDAGAKPHELIGRSDQRWAFRASMGVPSGMRRAAVDVGGAAVDVVILNMGNPQCVVLGPATEDRLQHLGPRLSTHPEFPEGTNVELAEIQGPDAVKMLIWERGVGRTESSGTGTCAAAVAAIRWGGAARRLTITAPGGSQDVDWPDDTAQLQLTGWAEIVAEVVWWQ